MKKLIFAVLVVAVMVVCSTGQAHAFGVLLNPGDSVAAVTASDPTSTATFLTSVTSPFSHNNLGITVAGSVYQEVWRENSSGYLYFLYQLTNNSPTAALTRMSTINYDGFTAYAGYEGGLIGPVTFTRSPGTGSTIGFVFPGATGLPGGGTTSAWMGIKTNAYGYAEGQTSVINGGSDDVFTYGPTAVPEPATMAMFGLGLLSIGGGVLRKKFKA